MATARLTIATSLVLALLWAGTASASSPPVTSAGSASASVSVVATGTAAVPVLAADPVFTGGSAGSVLSGKAGARKKALKKKARKRKKALKKGIRNCRKINKRAKRKRCVRRVRKKYAKPAKPKPNKPVKPVAPTAVHDVTIFDDVYTPDRLTIKAGEAIRFTTSDTDEDADIFGNKDAHNVSLFSGPKGVSPLDFESGSARSQGLVFQRTFRVPGDYRLKCSLHHLQLIDVTVTR